MKVYRTCPPRDFSEKNAGIYVYTCICNHTSIFYQGYAPSRDCLVLLVDATDRMFQTNRESEDMPFELCLKVGQFSFSTYLNGLIMKWPNDHAPSGSS